MIFFLMFNKIKKRVKFREKKKGACVWGGGCFKRRMNKIEYIFNILCVVHIFVYINKFSN